MALSHKVTQPSVFAQLKQRPLLTTLPFVRAYSMTNSSPNLHIIGGTCDSAEGRRVDSASRVTMPGARAVDSVRPYFRIIMYARALTEHRGTWIRPAFTTVLLDRRKRYNNRSKKQGKCSEATVASWKQYCYSYLDVKRYCIYHGNDISE